MNGSLILVPVDFQDASLDALALARELAGHLGFEVVLQHTYTVPLALYPGFDALVAPTLPEEMAKAARAALDELSAEQGGLRTILAAGDPAEQILKAIGELKPALVVMGTRGRKGLSHLLLGSVAERIVRLSSVPVLTVHARPR